MKRFVRVLLCRSGGSCGEGSVGGGGGDSARSGGAGRTEGGAGRGAGDGGLFVGYHHIRYLVNAFEEWFMIIVSCFWFLCCVFRMAIPPFEGFVVGIAWFFCSDWTVSLLVLNHSDSFLINEDSLNCQNSAVLNYNLLNILLCGACIMQIALFRATLFLWLNSVSLDESFEFPSF